MLAPPRIPRTDGDDDSRLRNPVLSAAATLRRPRPPLCAVPVQSAPGMRTRGDNAVCPPRRGRREGGLLWKEHTGCAPGNYLLEMARKAAITPTIVTTRVTPATATVSGVASEGCVIVT